MITSIHHQPVRLLEFGSSTCSPCITLMPELENIHRQFKSVDIVGVDMDDPDGKAAMASLVARQHVTYRQIVSTTKAARLAAHYGVQRYPSLYLLNSQGKVVWSFAGELGAPEFRSLRRTLTKLTE